MRQTSIEAFNVIKETGMLSKLRSHVYEFVFKNGPCTASQVHAGLAKGVADGSGSYTARLSELRDLGVIRELGETTCPYTGRMVILWDVTDALPRKITKRERLEMDLEKAETRVSNIRRQLALLEE